MILHDAFNANIFSKPFQPQGMAQLQGDYEENRKSRKYSDRLERQDTVMQQADEIHHPFMKYNLTIIMSERRPLNGNIQHHAQGYENQNP
jgi:hypothetical protein